MNNEEFSDKDVNKYWHVKKHSGLTEMFINQENTCIL